MERLSRVGAYGVIVKEGKLLLISQKEGVYKDLLHLPGGGIEFGESPEEALQRELKEEVAMRAANLDLLYAASSISDCVKEGKEVRFHHVGFIYSAKDVSLIQDAEPEEASGWYDLSKLPIEHLSPFAREVFPLICQAAKR